MTPETRKELMYADHDRIWTPQKRHVGPWRPRMSRTKSRLVWLYTRTANGSETVKHDTGRLTTANNTEEHNNANDKN